MSRAHAIHRSFSDQSRIYQLQLNASVVPPPPQPSLSSSTSSSSSTSAQAIGNARGRVKGGISRQTSPPALLSRSAPKVVQEESPHNDRAFSGKRSVKSRSVKKKTKSRSGRSSPPQQRSVLRSSVEDEPKLDSEPTGETSGTKSVMIPVVLDSEKYTVHVDEDTGKTFYYDTIKKTGQWAHPLMVQGAFIQQVAVSGMATICSAPYKCPGSSEYVVDCSVRVEEEEEEESDMTSYKIQERIPVSKIIVYGMRSSTFFATIVYPTFVRAGTLIFTVTFILCSSASLFPMLKAYL